MHALYRYPQGENETIIKHAVLINLYGRQVLKSSFKISEKKMCVRMVNCLCCYTDDPHSTNRLCRPGVMVEYTLFSAHYSLILRILSPHWLCAAANSSLKSAEDSFPKSAEASAPLYVQSRGPGLSSVECGSYLICSTLCGNLLPHCAEL